MRYQYDQSREAPQGGESKLERRLRAGAGWIGPLLIVAGAAMLVPWTAGWVAFGAAWTAIGVVLLRDRLGHVDRGMRAA